MRAATGGRPYNILSGFVSAELGTREEAAGAVHTRVQADAGAVREPPLRVSVTADSRYRWEPVPWASLQTCRGC